METVLENDFIYLYFSRELFPRAVLSCQFNCFALEGQFVLAAERNARRLLTMHFRHGARLSATHECIILLNTT